MSLFIFIKILACWKSTASISFTKQCRNLCLFCSVTSPKMNWCHKSLHKKIKFSIKYFFGICDQIRKNQRISSHLLKRSLMENFAFCAVSLSDLKNIETAIYLNLNLTRRSYWNGWTKFFQAKSLLHNLLHKALSSLFVPCYHVLPSLWIYFCLRTFLTSKRLKKIFRQTKKSIKSFLAMTMQRVQISILYQKYCFNKKISRKRKMQYFSSENYKPLMNSGNFLHRNMLLERN